jgi:hypothetical protein
MASHVQEHPISLVERRADISPTSAGSMERPFSVSDLTALEPQPNRLTTIARLQNFRAPADSVTEHSVSKDRPRPQRTSIAAYRTVVHERHG